MTSLALRRLRAWLLRLASLAGIGRGDAEIVEEIDAHRRFLADEYVRAGLSPDEAQRRAAADLGSASSAAAAYRDQRGLPWLEDLGRDARYAIRALGRAPGFTVVAVLTLGLGIGATTAISSIVDTVLLRPLPYAESERLVRVIEHVASSQPGQPPWQRGLRYQEYLDWRTHTETLSDVAGVAATWGLVRSSAGMVRLWGTATSPTTFQLLGTRALLGRPLVADDERDPSVVVLSFDTWQRLLRADPDVIGTTLDFHGAADGSVRTRTIVGVLPGDFVFPIERTQEFYIPITPDTSSRLTLIGRRRPEVAFESVLQEANVIGPAVTPPLPADARPLAGPRFDVQYVKDLAVEDLRPALGVFLAAVAVVLLVVCANMANLMLARGTSRQREYAVRLAIGASRGRVVRQVLTECLVLAAIGGALGTALGAAGIMVVKQLASVDAPGIFRFALGTSLLPRVQEIGVDPRMFGIACGIAALASLLFGMVPALHLSRTGHLQAMGSRGGGVERRTSRLRSALVVGQLVMATVLLVGAGLLVHSFNTLQRVERGFDPDSVLAFQIVFPPDYPGARQVDTIDAILTGLRATPGIDAAGFTRAGQLLGEQIVIGTFVPQGQTVADVRARGVWQALRPVSDGYLTAIGARVLEGRELEDADATAAMPAIVVSRSAARQLAGEGTAVGHVLDWHMAEYPPVQVQVVGVVEDLRNERPEHDPYAEVFIDYRRFLAIQEAWDGPPARQNQWALGFLSFAVRTRDDPALAAPTVSRIVRDVDPNAGVDSMRPLDQLVASSVARPRFYAVILGTFAGVAGLLAAIGVYGVLAYAVAQRTPEIGIRMALGAQRAQVLGLVLRTGLLLTATGIAIGLVAAAAGTRVLQAMLFGVTPLDPTTFAAVALLFGLVATCAAYVPARRATKVDPMIALRHE